MVRSTLPLWVAPPKDLDTRSESFSPHPHGFIAAPDHALVASSAISIEQLEQHEIMVREQGSGTRAVMEGFFSEHRFRPLSTIEMSSNETIKQAVMAGLGISFVSLHTIALELRHGVLRILPVQDTPVMRLWHVVNLTNRTLSLAAEAFRYFILERGNTLLEEMFSPLRNIEMPPKP